MLAAAKKENKAGNINVIQGEYAISDCHECFLTTVLGSCVATCMYDPVARIGGMNHYLLPGTKATDSDNVIYGLHLMELLINSLLKAGARRDRLQVKLFGGARMMQGLSDIGASNAQFAREFLERENIPLISASLGGERARRIKFSPSTGNAKQRLLGKASSVPVSKPAPKPAAPAPVSDDVELF